MLIPVRRIRSVLAAAWGIMLFAQSARARTQPPSLDEVVVTARRRDETFQNVPITVNVFTAQQIQSAGIENPRDFVAMVPNMTMVEVQNVGNSFIAVRGISQARNSEPSVAVLVDGVLETNPYQFNQELTDIQQIEVLKGPQGALYGRNAIGGAIIIHTVDPSDHFEGTSKVGIGNGVSEKAQVAVSGPIDDAGTLRYRASVNFYNTDGYLHNTYLDRKADPYRDYSGRLRLLWKPADEWSADLRVFRDRVETTAYYYIIPRDDEANAGSTFTTPPNANDVTSPIQNNNLGVDNRDVLDTALKLDYNAPFGTFTSVSDYNRTKEIDTGDAYDFRPVQTSIAYNAFFAAIPPGLGGPLDESQSQFIDVKTWSQELRFTANKVGGFSWLAGAYFVHTERFISTDNIVDRGAGVPRVYQNPLIDPTNPFATNTNVTFLSDSQNNNAWAVFGEATFELTHQLELDAAIRYDEDSRRNTTDTPTQFLPDPTAFNGEVRKHTFSETQPKGQSHNGYFFYFDSTTSTQNLGNLDATYKGVELELTAKATDRLDIYANFGYTDGKITRMEDPTVVGNKPPLLTKDTIGAGLQYRQPLVAGINGTLRLEYQQIGRTWWDPYNVTSRDPVNLIDLRAGFEGDRWTVTAWSKNLTNKIYNAEFSSGGFLWRALPRRYGVDFTFKF
jgi:iron complex outermembrane receptor protein